MFHYISGLPNTDGPKGLKITNGIWSFGGLKVLEYEPIADPRVSSTIHPTVTSSPFDSIVSLGMFYIQKESGYKAGTPDQSHNSPCIVTNFVTGDWSTLPEIKVPDPASRKGAFTNAITSIRNETLDDLYIWWSRPNATFKGQAIVAVADPGPNTGEIVIQWPKLDLTTNPNTEFMTGAFRVYTKTYLKNESNVLVIPAARISGCLAGVGAKLNMWERPYSGKNDDLVAFITKADPADTRALLADPLYREQCNAYNLYSKWFNKKSKHTVEEKLRALPTILYRGTMRRADGGIRCDNQGALGVLDHPANGL